MADFEQNKRLKILIEDVFKVSPVEFAKKYNDIKAVKTYNILSERNGISNKMLDQILRAYPKINKVWLLTGEGDMLKGDIEIKFKNTDMFDFVAMGSDVYADLLDKLIKEKRLAPFALLEQKDQEIKELNREIGRLEERLQNTKKMDVQADNDAVCADVG